MSTTHRPLRVAFAKLYESHGDVVNARVIFEKAVQVGYKTVDDLATVWCEWAEMELRHKNFKGALDLMQRATAEPSVAVKRKSKLSGTFKRKICYVQKLSLDLKLFCSFMHTDN